MWIINTLLGNSADDREEMQVNENKEVQYSQNGVYVDPELLKSHIEPPYSPPKEPETIFSRSRERVRSDYVNITDLSSSPLPTPPKGMYWENKNGEWKCINVETASPLSGEGAPNLLEEGRRSCSTDEHVWIDHLVMPGDTLRGICLKYRCSAVELRRYNNFSGDAFRSRKSLRIKVSRKHVDSGDVLVQDKSLVEVKIQELKSRIDEPSEECMYYLRENDYDVGKAFKAWEEDEKFTIMYHPPIDQSDNHTTKKNIITSQRIRGNSVKSVNIDKNKKDL